MKVSFCLCLGVSLGGLCLIAESSTYGAESPQQYLIIDHAHRRAFVIAPDELQVYGERHPRKILAAANSQTMRSKAEALSSALGKEVSLVLYPTAGVRSEFTRRILTRQILVHGTADLNLQDLARSPGIQVIGPLDYLPGHYLLETTNSGSALEVAQALRQIPGVISAEPQLARLAQKKLVPNDSLFAQEWHLRNTGQNGGTPGLDINVTNVWNSWRGTNIYIAIVDDGLQYTHPDLAPNANTVIDYDFNFHDLDPYPSAANGDFHGTSVAGVAAARGNNALGVCGAAYEAKLVGLRLISLAETDADDAAAMAHSNSVIHIKNNSWGAPDCLPPPFGNGTVLDGPGVAMKAAIAQGVATGRGNKGVIYVFAAGNGLRCGEDVNYDAYANSINVFPIGAINDLGLPTFYGEPGACLVGVVPSSDYPRQEIVTTDLVGNDGYNYSGAPDELTDLNYTKTFGGTSSSAPLASGIIALMLQANTNLNYRDVKEILLRSSTRIQPTDRDWQTNSAGIAHNHKFGGGLLNAEAAITLATNWAYLGAVSNLSLLHTNLNLPIPDNDSNGLTQTFTFTNREFRVEHLTLTMTAPHPYWGDLAVTVTSPSGITSRLAELHAPVDTTYNYQAWTLSSLRHWGEKASGTWTVKVADLASTYSGVLQALELKLYGTTPLARLRLVRTNQNILLNLEAAAPGWTYALESSSDRVTWNPLANLTIPTSGKASYTDINALLQSRRFYRARLLP